MKSSSIVLYFIKEIDGFKEEGEADEPRHDQDYCQHSFVLRSYCQTKCPTWLQMRSGLIYKDMQFVYPCETGSLPYQNERGPFKMKTWWSYQASTLIWYSSIFRYRVVRPMLSSLAASVLLPLV